MSLTPEQIADIETKATAAGLDLRQMARLTVESRAEEIDYMGVGEMHEDGLSLLGSDEDYSTAQKRITDLAYKATVTVTWDDAPTVEPEPTGPRPGQQRIDPDGEIWVCVAIPGLGRRWVVSSPAPGGALTSAELEELWGPTTPVRDAADVMSPAEAAQLEAAVSDPHDPADYVEAKRPEPIRLCCGHPCPDHDHTCDRSPQHLGFHRDAREKNTETCSWVDAEPDPADPRQIAVRLMLDAARTLNDIREDLPEALKDAGLNPDEKEFEHLLNAVVELAETADITIGWSAATPAK